METINKKKEAVTAIMFYGGKVLAVSRKDNFQDFGTPGGKVDPGENLVHALIREVFEETGLTPLNFEPIFTREDDEYHTTTFLVKKWIGQIVKREAGVVAWVDYDVIEKGSFGAYNTLLKNELSAKIGEDLGKLNGSYEVLNYHSILDWSERYDSTLHLKDFDCNLVSLTHIDKSMLTFTNSKILRFLVTSPFIEGVELEELVVVFSEHHRPVTYFMSDLKDVTIKFKEIVNKYSK